MQTERNNLTLGNENVSTLFKNSSFDQPVSDNDWVISYSTEIKVTFVAIAFISVMSSLTAIIFMHRSKKTSYAAKLLTRGLLTFDVLFIVTSTVRKFISNSVISYNFQSIVLTNLQLTYFTVGLMSVERYFVILKPMKYVEIVTERFVQKTALIIWLSEICLCLFIRNGVCYIRYQTTSVFHEPGYCINILSYFYASLLFVVLACSCFCYIKIFKCILSKLSPGNTAPVPGLAETIRNHPSTCLSFIYLVLILITALAYGAIILSTQLGHLQAPNRSLAYEFVCIFNCILDPFLYVFWYKECRLQLLTLLAVFLKRYRGRARQMRIEVYNIVTVEMKAVRSERNA